MQKEFNLRKESIRGTIKQFMRVRGLRTISLANYTKFMNQPVDDMNVHSVKFDIMNGYLYLHAFNQLNGKCGKQIENPSIDTYEQVYELFGNILQNEKAIPSKVKRNILVKVCR